MTITKKILFIVFLTISLFSCESGESSTGILYNQEIQFRDSNYKITSQTDLKDFILEVIDNSSALLNSYSFQEFTDSNNEKFDAIAAKYTLNGNDISLVIPLNSISNKSSNNTNHDPLLRVAYCEMTCSAQTGCGGCDQTIYKPCSKQTCNCKTSGTLGCNSSIQF